MSSKSLSGVVEDSGGSWLEFWFLILMGRGQEYSKQPIFPNSAFYIEQKGAKNSHVLEVPVWSCGGLWRFLTGVLVPDHDGDRSTMSQTPYVPKFGFLHWIKRAKNPHVLVVMDWGFGGLWRFLIGVLVPDHDENALPHISGFRRYLNIPKRTTNGQVINYGPWPEIVTSGQTETHCYFVYIDNPKII